MAVPSWITSIWKRLGTGRDPGTLACGDCERCDRCGLAPHDDCIVKAAQLARTDGRPLTAHDRFISEWTKT